MRHLADVLREIPGVKAVALGGSRAAGTAKPDSDWDFGLYYEGRLDTGVIRALGWKGTVFEPGDWGSIVNGGAWLEVDGQRVDLIYRDLAEVHRWTTAATAGHFEIRREVGYLAGIPTYVLSAELAGNEVLAGDLPRPEFSEALRSSAPPLWDRLSAGALHFARVHLDRGDTTASVGNLAQAVLAAAHSRLAARGVWVTNEKGLVVRAGLEELMASVRQHTCALALETVSAELAGAWGPNS